MTRSNGTGVTAAALAGAATGLRSLTGLAALGLTAPGAGDPRAERLLARPPVRLSLAAAGAGELAADKLPMAPSRLQPSGLVPRLLLGALTGVLAAGRTTSRRPSANEVLIAAGVGTVAAGAAAWTGSHWRALPAVRRRALLGALLEDVVAVGLGVRAAGGAHV